MRTSRVPLVIDGIIAAVNAATPTFTVSDGLAVTDDPAGMLLVGVDDPRPPGDVMAAQSRQEYAALGSTRPRDEHGSVTCWAFAADGGGSMKVARDAAYAIVGVVETALRADPTIGAIPGVLNSRIEQLDLSQNQDDMGASAIVVFSVTYTARI